MGNSQQVPALDATKAPPVEADTSSGFHIVEIHSPTVGYSMGTILIVLALIVLFVKCCLNGKICLWLRPSISNRSMHPGSDRLPQAQEPIYAVLRPLPALPHVDRPMQGPANDVVIPVDMPPAPPPMPGRLE